MTLIDEIVAADNEMRAIRHEIHAHPELGYEVHRTADLVALCLQAWGVVVTRGVGKTGIVGYCAEGLAHARSGYAPTWALPLNEVNGFGYRSTVQGCCTYVVMTATRPCYSAPRVISHSIARSIAPSTSERAS